MTIRCVEGALLPTLAGRPNYTTELFVPDWGGVAVELADPTLTHINSHHDCALSVYSVSLYS